MNVIEFENIQKTYKNFSIDDFYLRIPQGFVTGLIGPNGSGKTTLIRLLMDIIHPDQGQLKLFGESHTNIQAKQAVGFVYDDLYVYEELTIKSWQKIVGPLYPNWDQIYFEKLLKEFELPFKKKFKFFSKGMKMKTQLLFALSHHPKLLILDEPTAGLDPIFRRKLIKFLQDWMTKDNRSILYTTHITSDLDQLGDYFVLLNQGQIQTEFSNLDLQADYHIIKGSRDLIDQDIRQIFISLEEDAHHFQGLYQGDLNVFDGIDVMINHPTLEDMLYFYLEGGRENVCHHLT